MRLLYEGSCYFGPVTVDSKKFEYGFMVIYSASSSFVLGFEDAHIPLKSPTYNQRFPNQASTLCLGQLSLGLVYGLGPGMVVIRHRTVTIPDQTEETRLKDN